MTLKRGTGDVRLARNFWLLLSRTSKRKDCGNPPLKPSAHLTEKELVDVFEVVQL